MKNLLLIGALLSFFTATNSMAIVAGDDIRDASIYGWELGTNTGIENGQMKVVSGSLQINHSKQEVTLMLERRIVCEPFAACIAMMPTPYKVTLPIIATSQDCGRLTIRAQRNLIPVDGANEEILIEAFMPNYCFDYHAANASVSVETYIKYSVEFYDRVNGKLVSGQSQFFASELSRRIY